jgi:hypothetical protein
MVEYEKSAIISKINKASNDISDIWNHLSGYGMRELSEAWNDSISHEYIEKFNETHEIIDSIITHLDNLKDCWENYNSE